MKEEQPTRSEQTIDEWYRINDEIDKLRAELEQVRRERDAALGNDLADYHRLARLLEIYDTAMRKDRDFAKTFAARTFELEERAEAAEQSRERMREALEKVIAHTAYLPGASAEFLEELLASCKRIAVEGLKNDD